MEGLEALSGLLNNAAPAAPPADAGTSKIPLTLLPPGVQPGQRISLTVTGIDPLTGTATVVPDAVQNAVPAAPASAMQPLDMVDKELTMGPMDNLRSYLSKKTMEQQEMP